MHITNYRELLAHLDTLGMFHMDLRLERMEQGLRTLDLLPPPYAVAQVVGTNGKGSTASFLASLGKAHGIKTGLFTSPHLLSPRERIRINGEMLSEERWTALARRVLPAAPELTYFECICLMAVLAFAEDKVQLAIMEAGLGGRSDATSALPAHLTCFTPIGYDHMEVLGNSLQHIAQDKAAAMRKNTPTFTARQSPEVLTILLDVSRRIKSPLLRAEESCVIPPDWRLGLRGAHQIGNASLALAAWGELARQHNWPTRDAQVREGLEKAFIAGRLQRIPANRGLPDIMLDGAHNTHAFAALRAALRDLGILPRAVIFACLADKDLDGMAQLALDIALGAPLLIPALSASSRTVPPMQIAATFGATASTAPNLKAALKAVRQWETTPQSPILICGSLYLLAEFFTLYPEYLHA
jgi:dihydrofolate synthase/folylpolyglutamate synthase